MLETSWREPIEFAAGDTLSFKRRLPQFPSATWTLTYEIRGGAAAIQFQSTPDTDNVTHQIHVAPAVTALWLPGSMFMEGYAGNGVDRERIYFGELSIVANLEGSGANIPVKTFKQILLERMETCLLNFTTSGLLETRIGETMFRYTTPKELFFAYGLAYQARQNEIAKQRAQNGQNPGNKILPRARVVKPGPYIGNGIYPFVSGDV